MSVKKHHVERCSLTRWSFSVSLSSLIVTIQFQRVKNKFIHVRYVSSLTDRQHFEAVFIVSYHKMFFLNKWKFRSCSK